MTCAGSCAASFRTDWLGPFQLRIINDRGNNISGAINNNAAIPLMAYGGIINDRSKVRRSLHTTRASCWNYRSNLSAFWG